MKTKPQQATPQAERRKEEKRKASAFPKWIDPVTLSEEDDEPELNLLGENGFLRRGGGMFIIGPTEAGKSSLGTQLSCEWGCNYPNAIIKTANSRALRVLMVQSEDDRQDSREMARCIKFLKLTPEQKAQVKKNVHFAHWRASSETRFIPGANGGEQPVEVSATDRLLEVLENAIEKFGLVDIIIVNPLSAYVEEGLYGQRSNQNLLYGKIDPFLMKHDCGIIFIHHPPKVREGGKTIYLPVYAASGDATLSNWPRASLLIWPQDPEEIFKFDKIFKFEPGKRANRLGWDESRFYKWSTEGIFWLRASDEEVRRFTASAKGKSKAKGVSREDLYDVFWAADSEWVSRGDIVWGLTKDDEQGKAGYPQATVYRSIDQDEGYLREMLLYRGKGKKLQLKWNGQPPIIFNKDGSKHPFRR